MICSFGRGVFSLPFLSQEASTEPMDIKNILTYREPSEIQESSTERTLLAAVLQRAFFDLDYITSPRCHVKSAIDWFRAIEDWPFSFKFACLILDLGEEAVQYIEPILVDAEYYISATDGKLLDISSAKNREIFAIQNTHFIAAKKRVRTRLVS